ncbi:HTH-type transcriptional regulator/antitoxin HipB [Variovorax sp. TBS-050B]|uniref:helix-turn-helix domain-containing protein n=1 Tax=Variovorax sp. TBS-050B TaxID=2940551 RepID=UPI0024770AE4|nr:helix-turn-helix domain-containing protein [Variovorax sp. TBS-050B]MDH6594221.1 HTH-type transcriptional regulator/antitoxin HipB [Variovorax sp. TBS-050B]
MTKQELITALSARRDATGLSHAALAQRSGLTERSVRNALSLRGNPQLSSLLALVDALGLELQLAPKGFGAPAEADTGYRPVPTRVGTAVGRAEAAPAAAPASSSSSTVSSSTKRSP